MCFGFSPRSRDNTANPFRNVRNKENKFNPSRKVHPHDLNISFWNINGYKSRIVGNKFADPDFLVEVQKCDIVGIGETHIHDEILEELSIPGFVLLKYKNRKKSTRNNKSFGGIAIFVKPEIKNIVHPIETENQDIIWLKMNKTDLKVNNDVYIGTAYISPHKGKLTESNKIQNLADDIIRDCTQFMAKRGRCKGRRGHDFFYWPHTNMRTFPTLRGANLCFWPI